MKTIVFGSLCISLIALLSVHSEHISVHNSGSFNATFDVQYYLKGRNVHRNGTIIRIRGSASINIPAKSSHINLRVAYFKTPRNSSVIFTRSFYKPETHCYEIWGNYSRQFHQEYKCYQW